MRNQLFCYPIKNSDSIEKIYFLKQKNKILLEYCSIPVSAGKPYSVEDYVAEEIDLSDFLFAEPDKSLIVKVYGDSMIDAGIKPGFSVVLDRKIEPKHGDIVVASVNNELTLKGLKIEKNKISLIPANKNYQEIEINEYSNFKIIGVLIHFISGKRPNLFY